MKIRIATRASPLALWQANHVAGLLRAAHEGVAVELVEVSTVGDRDRANTLASFGGTGVFTREVQRAVLDGRADVAVHSLKDLPTAAMEGLVLAAVPAREDRRDALVLPADGRPADCDDPLAVLSSGARVATGSPRRQAQLLHRRPDLEVAGVRGNVGTRLEKLDAGEFDAMVLAVAGLKRLGFASRVSAVLEPPVMYPAVGQGALGLECRADDGEVTAAVGTLADGAATLEVTAERSMMARLGAGCHAPVGAFATSGRGESEGFALTGVVLSPDGSRRIESVVDRVPWPDRSTAAESGVDVAERLLSDGASEFV
ncbi:MAG: hydroxymethylbilane synthase [Planctomycetota bacterium]